MCRAGGFYPARVQSLAAAARFLQNATSLEGVTRLLGELGFAAPSIALSKEESASIGLTGEDGRFTITAGQGARRGLTFIVDDGCELRPEIARVANRLASRAPHLLWVITAFDSSREEFAIGASEPRKSGARVVALVAKTNQIVDSDAETVCALAAATGESDMILHARWLEILGRDSVGKRFFKALESCVSKLADDLRLTSSLDSSELALLYTSRLLFLSFLETKGWLDGDHGFLGNRYADCMVSGGGYHRRVLVPLFFGTLNTSPKNRAARAHSFGRIPFLNGGLFSRSALERKYASSFFSDESLGDLFSDVLTRYRFTAREDTTTWSEAAIDPEMLGRAFESLMSAATRKTSGAFYTPQSLVVELTRTTLSSALSSPLVSADCVAEALGGESLSRRQVEHLLGRLDTFKVIDPACGSGAFLVHVLEVLSTFRQQLGDSRGLHEIRRTILTNSIFGVDINPTAVWLCELRLWLCMAIENPERDPMRVAPLPNLDRHIRVGDSLLSESFESDARLAIPRRFSTLRAKYSRASGPRKRSLGKMLDRSERECSVDGLTARLRGIERDRTDLLMSYRSRDLFGSRAGIARDAKVRLHELRCQARATRRDLNSALSGGALPFSFATHFADAAVNGGFDVVVGNPPWVRTHNLDRASRSELRRNYSVYRAAAWQSGSESSAAGRGFSSQVDVASLFVERCVSLSREGGTVGLILPSKLWRSLAGGGVRALLQDRTSLVRLDDLTDAKQVFDAAVYPSIIVSRRASIASHASPTLFEIHRKNSVTRWRADPRAIPFDETPGSPWILLPHDVRKAFDAVRGAGIPFSQSQVGRPVLGVKSGCNEAFIVQRDGVECEVLRPLLRGDRIAQWRLPRPVEHIIWTHDATGQPMRTLPPRALARLSRFRPELEARSDARQARRWWSLFRTEAAECSRPRVVWSDVSRSPRAAVIPAGDNTVPINSCYIARCATETDAFALTAILNSPLVAAWLSCVAEPARGGYHRYLGWTMSILPLPLSWKRSTIRLASIGKCAFEGNPPSQEDLHSATLCAYGLSDADVARLLNWAAP